MKPKLITGAIVFWYALLAAGFVFWSQYYQSARIKSQLMWAYPLGLKLLSLIIAIALIVNFKGILRLAKRLGRANLALAALIAAAGIITTSVAVPRTHRIFYDETIYLHIAQNIALTGEAFMCNEGEMLEGDYRPLRQEYNKQPNGYPFILSLFFSVFGVHEWMGFAVNNLLFGICALAVFLIGACLFDAVSGLFAALIFVLIPVNIVWGNTAAVEPATAALAAVALAAFSAASDRLRPAPLLLALALLGLAITFRPEALLLTLPALALVVLYHKEIFKRRYFYLELALVLTALLPHFVHLATLKGNPWGASGPKFALDYFGENLRNNFSYFVNNKDFPLFFTLLAFVGLAYPLRLRAKTIAALWFFSMWGVFLFFYAGSYYYGADVRFVLLCLPPIALLAGYGLKNLAQLAGKWLPKPAAPCLAAALVIIAFLFFLPQARQVGEEAWAARADTEYAREFNEILPPDSFILTHNPNMFLLWGQSAGQASILTSEPDYLNYLKARYPGGVYFHYNFWCGVSDPVQVEFCQNILNKYALTEIKRFKLKTYDYALYRIDSLRP